MKNQNSKSGNVPVTVCEVESISSIASQTIFAYTHTGNLNSVVGQLSIYYPA
ncbi:MAG: hypothetical protein IPO27_10910 [Bacteroidetes bacterium]|nr:hypothetical protein [Bacteroidota bacterium]